MREHRRPSRSAGRSFLADVLVVTVAAALFAAFVESLRPLPFASSDDNPIYYGPLILLHTDALLAGRLPRMFWELGAGWTPFESCQVGLFYPPFVLANLAARALGRPLLLLEVSAWLHLWAAGLVTLRLLPARVRRFDRLAWALLAMAQPAPFLIGMNWHDYVAPYPWFLAMALLLVRDEEPSGPWGTRALCMLSVASLGFWWTAHPQMYVLGVAALGAWSLALGRRSALSGVAALAVAQVPFAVPVLYVRTLALNASVEMMAGRAAATHVLAAAQSLPTVLTGLLLGNLGGPQTFQPWPGAGTGGQGLLFAPWLAWSWVLAAARRRWAWIATSTAFVLVMAIGSFPWLARAFPAALAFRWTWKLAVYLGPLAMLAIAVLAPPARSWWRAAAVGVLAVASAVVCFRGVRFELWPALTAFHARGFEAVIAEARTLLAGAGVEPGSRIAVISPADTFLRRVSAPVAAVTGAAPIWLGLESAHTYEPLEHRAASAWHGDLTVPWRRGVRPEDYLSDPAGQEAWLASIGVSWIVTDIAGVLPEQGTTVVRDHLGAVTFLRRIPGAPPTFPWDDGGPGRRSLERLPGGSLRSVEASPEAPRLALPRAVRWRRLGDGRWEGTPVVLAEGWIVAGALGALAWVGAVAIRARHAPAARRARD